MRLPFSNYVKAHHISHAMLAAAALAAAIVFFVLGVGLRLLIGPVSLGPLGGTIAQAVQGALPGITLKYDQAAVKWDRDEGRVHLVILGARIFDAAGRIVAQAPQADIDLAARPFLEGKFVVRRITLVGVQLTLVRMPDGELRLGVEADRGEGDIIARLKDAIAHGGTASALGSFAVRSARLAIYDELTGLFIVAPRARLSIERRNGAIETGFEADVEISGRPAHVRSDFTVPVAAGPVSGTASITGLDLRALGVNAAMFASLKTIALTTDLSATFTLAPDAHIARADFSAEASGQVPVPGMKRGLLHVNRLQLSGRYDGAAGRVVIGDAALDAQEARAHLKGDFHLLYDRAGALGEVDSDLGASQIALVLPGLLAGPVNLQSVQLRARYLRGARDLEIERLTAGGPGLAFDASGGIVLGEAGQSPAIVMQGRLGALPVRELLRYWPLAVAPDAREWIVDDIFAGIIGPFVFAAHFPAGLLDGRALPEDSFRLTFPIKDVEGNYLTGLTHVTGVTGSAILTGDNFTAAIVSGHIGAIAISQGNAVIQKLHVPGTTGEFTAHADGTMPDILNLIDMKPLNYPTRFGVSPASTQGNAHVDLSFHVPMLRDLRIEDVGISVKAAVSDFAVTLGSHTRLTDGNVNFTVDNHRLHQTGTVSLADSKLAVDWTEDFDTKDFNTTRLLVKGTLSDASRAALDLGLEDIVIGPLGVNGALIGHHGSLIHADFTLDVTPTVFSVGILGLEKSAGLAGAGHVSVDFAPGNIVRDESVSLTGPNLTANGTATFDNGTLTSLSFPSVRMGALNDLGFEMTRKGAERDFNLHGRSLDGSKIGSTQGSGNLGTTGKSRDEMPEGPYRVTARLDRLILREGVAIAPLQLDMSGTGNWLSALTLAGNLTKTAAISAKMETLAAGRRLTLAAADAGELIKGLIGFTSIKGGRADLAVNFPGRADAAPPDAATPDYQGTFTISDFKLTNEPFLTRLFAAGSLTGVADLLQGGGISFDKLELGFSSKNNVISVHDARAAGPAIGATADGYVDRPKHLLALKGSLVPAYGLNSVLGVIPLVGNLLVSKKGEGVLGVTYSVNGNLDNPSMSVNPLSMLTPGFLRRIFQGHIPNASNAPSNAPANAAPPLPESPPVQAPSAAPAN